MADPTQRCYGMREEAQAAVEEMRFLAERLNHYATLFEQYAYEPTERDVNAISMILFDQRIEEKLSAVSAGPGVEPYHPDGPF